MTPLEISGYRFPETVYLTGSGANGKDVNPLLKDEYTVCLGATILQVQNPKVWMIRDYHRRLPKEWLEKGLVKAKLCNTISIFSRCVRLPCDYFIDDIPIQQQYTTLCGKAISICYLYGAKRFVLSGFDYEGNTSYKGVTKRRKWPLHIKQTNNLLDFLRNEGCSFISLTTTKLNIDVIPYEKNSTTS